MTVRDALKRTLSRPPPTNSKRTRFLTRPSKHSTTAPPRAKVNFALSGFKGFPVPVRSDHPRHRGLQYLLLDEYPFHRPNRVLDSSLRSTAFASKMLNYVQIVNAPTADTPGTTLICHFDNRRYVFGNIAEGTQRAFTQRKVGMNKIEDIFLTGVIDWHNTGGLFGMILTMADTIIASAKDMANLRESGKAKADAAGPSHLNIHGGKNLTHLLATARRFVFRKGFPLHPIEIRHDTQPAHETESAPPDWEDVNIKVWYLPVQSSIPERTQTRKRSHEEFSEPVVGGDKKATSVTSAETEDHALVETVVKNMFNSEWSVDSLVETTLHQVKLPAKIFVRDQNRHIQKYTGPMPEPGVDVPDIPVLVRLPWPGATVVSLPRTRPSKQSMCYIVKNHDRRGRFKPQIAESYGVVKRDYGKLTKGESVTGKDGVVVTPEMVLSETVPGTGFALLDVPDATYIEALLSRKEWSNKNIMSGINTVFWILGSEAVNDGRLKQFMERDPEIKHIVCSTTDCPNMIAFESVAAQTYNLHHIDPDRFPLPLFNNDIVKNGATPVYEQARVGKTVQFAPQFMHQDDKIVPFPDLRKLAKAKALDQETLDLAAQGRKKISDPAFDAKVEAIESDIPNRDAEIIPLGTGSALPSKYRNVSATLVRVPGYGNYLFDCGENTLGQLRRSFGDELPQVLRDLKAIWISHLHADHHLGTARVIKAWHDETLQSNPEAKLHVGSHLQMMQWLREYADVEDYGYERLTQTVFTKNPKQNPHVFTEAQTAQHGLQRIDACFVEHCFGALAVAFTWPSGLKIAYSGDCRPSDDFAEIGSGATLLIHESTFDDELRGDALAKKHSTMSEALDVGRRMGARRILLTHFSQRYQKVQSFEDAHEAPEGASPLEKARADEVILVAFDMMRVKLGDFRRAQAFLPAVQKYFEDIGEQ